MYNLCNEGMALPEVKYGNEINDLFVFLQKEQINDIKLWKLLVKQFKRKSDTKDRGWRGEFWGKLMRSACLLYAYNRDGALYNILHKAVDFLLEAQDKLWRISTYRIKNEFTGWDMWCRKYVMLGLEYYLEICKDELQKRSVVSALVCQADYIIDRIGKGKIPIEDTSDIWGGLNSYSILQPFVKLYKITKDSRYKDFAQYIIESQDVEGMNFFKKAYENKIPPFRYSVTKAYETISCFEGQLEYYEVTGENKYLDSCVNFADSILKTDYTIVGGTGCRSEYFDNSTSRQVLSDPSTEMQETCVTVTFMKYLAKLFTVTKKSSYMDAVERSYFNLYLGVLNRDYKKNKQPIFMSYSPIVNNPRWNAVGGKKNIGAGRFFGCCISIGSTGLGIIPKCSALLDNEENCIYLNQFFSADYSFSAEKGKIMFSVNGNYPDSGKVSIKFDKLPQNGVKLKIRRPNWCDKFYLSLSDAQTEYFEKDGYIEISGLSEGNEYILEMYMPLKYLNSEFVYPDIDYRVALSKGPVVLAFDDFKKDCVFPLDYSVTQTGECVLPDGKREYGVKLKNGQILKLFRYSDCGKSNITKMKLNVWFRIK